MAKSRRAPDEEVRRARPDDDEDDAPRRKGRASEDDEDEDEDNGVPEKPRKKKKSAAGPVKLILRICAGAAGAILLLILLYWVYQPVGTDSKLFCYFPQETTTLRGYDADEGFKNAKLKDVHDVLVSNYKVFGDRRFNSDCGVTSVDVEKYMSGVAAGDPEEEKDLPIDSQERRGELTVIRFKKDIDTAKFIGSFKGSNRCDETKSRDGKAYYQVQQYVTVTAGNQTQQELKDDISFFFPNNRTLVYATTRRELEEALKRQPGRVIVTGDMRELADKMDGVYFTCSKGWYEFNGQSNSLAFGLGFIDAEVRDQKTYVGVTGTASWFASNGNDFLYASATLYSDKPTAKYVLGKLNASLDKAQSEIWQSESGKPSGLEDPFNPKPKTPAGGGGPGAGGPGMPGPGMGAPSTSSEQSKAILEALSEYSGTARAYRRGRLVIIEGRISHGMPEQGVFEKFWAAVGPKFRIQSQFGGGMMGGMGGPGGPPMPGGPPGGPAPPPPIRP